MENPDPYQLNQGCQGSQLSQAEATKICQYQELWDEQRQQHSITSVTFLDDSFDFLVHGDMTACARGFLASQEINTLRNQGLLNHFLGITVPTESLLKCIMLDFLRNTAWYSTASDVVKALCTKSLHSLAATLPDWSYDNAILQCGILANDEISSYTQHAWQVQSVIEDPQIMNLMIMLVATEDQPSCAPFRKHVGQLLLKKIYTNRNLDDNGYPKVYEDFLGDLIEGEPKETSLEIFENFYNSFDQVCKILAPKVQHFMSQP